MIEPVGERQGLRALRSLVGYNHHNKGERMDNVFTVSDLSRKLGLTTAVIKTVTKDLSPDLSMNDGYYKFYSIDRVTDALIERNRPLLVALGFVEATGQAEAEEAEESE